MAVKLVIDTAMEARINAELQGIANGALKAMASGINKTLVAGRTLITKELSSIVNVQRRQIADRITLEKATATPTGLTGSIIIQRRRIGLINFGPKDTGKGKGRARKGQGVIAQAYRTGAPERFPTAFIATGLNRNRHVFTRFSKWKKVEKAHHQPNVGRNKQQIRALKGLSLYDVYRKHPGVDARINLAIAGILQEKLLSAIDWQLGRSKGERPE